jgi:hypothetical protein
VIKNYIPKHRLSEKLKLGDVLEITFPRGYTISFDVTRLGYFEAWHTGIQGSTGDVIITPSSMSMNSTLTWEDRLLERIRLGKIIRR